VIFEPGKKKLFLNIYLPPTLIYLSHCFTSASKSTAQKSFDCCLSHFCTFISTSSSLAKCLPPRWNRFKWQTHPTINRKHFFMNILCIESFCPQNMHDRMLLFGSTPLKHSSHFDYWNQPLNMCMPVCYLDYHEAELCFYLMIHTENILYPL
jgi:hypothetical protein